MPIVLDVKNNPLYNKGWNEAWNEARIDTTIKNAIIAIKEFGLNIEDVSKKFNIPVNLLKKRLNEIK